MWIVLACVMLMLLAYIVVLVRNAIEDKENSKVTWRNFLVILPVLLVCAGTLRGART